MKVLRAFIGCLAIMMLCYGPLHAGTFNAFGPQTYVRNTSTPVTVSNSFSVLNPNTQYTLHVQNSGAASAIISINGAQILGPSDFNPNVTVLDRPVTLQLNNTIAVQVRSAPGTSLKATIIGVDNDLPVITASAAPAADTFGWNNTNVVVTFTCSDKTSGVAFCPPAVTVSTEAANQLVTGTAFDRAGNAASASVTLNIDKSAPSISAVAVPPPNAFGWNNANSVTVTFNCLDLLSGIASCTPPAILNAEGANQIAAGTAVDKAGNMASTSATVSIDRTPPAITAQASPAANPAGWNNTGVTVAFTCVDSLSGVASCPPAAIVNSEGANQNISGTSVDKAGNSASAAVVLNIDKTPPTVIATPVPAPNSLGWNNTNVTINFNCSDTLSGVDSCPAQAIATTEGANQVFSGTATDRAGNAATASATLNIDKTPPNLKITAPLSGATVIVPTVTLEGLVTDTLSGVAGVTCNGAPAQVSGAALTCGVPLSAGLNTISIVATDVAGNATTSTLTINFSATPTITIASPLNLSTVNATPVTVTGTVSDPNAIVSVNGTAVALVSGSFSTPVVLKEGGNTITVVAQSGGGAPATATISVSLDTTPPHVTIDSPADGTVTTASTIAVAGMINDIVPGTVNAQQAGVTVNGIPAQVLNRNYLLRAVPLSPGPNTITAIGTDLAGNTASVSITVVQKAVISQPTINLAAGDGQTGIIGTALAAPLVVQLKDGAGNPVAGQPVVFKVTGSNGTLSGNAIAGANGGPTLVINSDVHGMAQVAWTLGMRAGAGNNTVKATAANFVGEANFGAITLPATPGLISVDSGNNQFGAVGQPLPHPFVLVVTDAGHNRLANIPVTFTVQQGGGTFVGQGTQIGQPGQTNFTSIIIKTDSDGRAMAVLTLGQQEGVQNNLVEANFPGNQGFPATFSASGRVAGDPAATSISGVALDNTNIPIAGITMQVENTALTTQTDQQGQFLLTGVPVGKVKLIADGATAARPGTWPKLEYELVTVSGTNNTLGMPVYLLPLDLPHGLQVDETHGGTLTLPDVPGFSLTIAPGSVTFPDGGKSGLVSITVVHADKVPMTPNFGQQPRFIISIQPAGAHFNPPAPMTLPNVDGLSPGEVTEMYSFDHDLGSFVAIGTGTVSKDGSVIKSDPGVGIVKGGWHCGGNPSAIGTVADCPVCDFCVGVVPPNSPSGTVPGTCVPDPGQMGNACTPQLNNCMTGSTCGIDTSLGFPRPTGVCGGGTPLPNGTNCNAGGATNATCQGGVCTGTGQQCPSSCIPTSPAQCVDYGCSNGACTTAIASDGTACMLSRTQPGICMTGQCQPTYPCIGQADGTTCSINGSASGVCLNSQCAVQNCGGQSPGTACNGGGSIPGTCTSNNQGILQCTGSGTQCPLSCNGSSCINGVCAPPPAIQLSGIASEQFPGVGQNSLPGNSGGNPAAQTLVILGARSDGLVYGTATFQVSSPATNATAPLVGGLGTCAPDGSNPHVLYQAVVTGTALSFTLTPPLFPIEIYPLMGLDSNGDGILEDAEVLSNCDSQSYRFRIVSPAYSSARAFEAKASLLAARLAGYPLSANFLDAFLTQDHGDGTEFDEFVDSLNFLGTLDHHVGLQFDASANKYVLPKIVYPSTSATAQTVRTSEEIGDALRNTLDAGKLAINGCSLPLGSHAQLQGAVLQGNAGGDVMKFHSKDLFNAIGAANISGHLNAVLTRTTTGLDATNIALDGLILDLYDWFYIDVYPPPQLAPFLPNIALFKMVDIQANYLKPGDAGRVYRNVIDISGTVPGTIGLRCP